MKAAMKRALLTIIIPGGILISVLSGCSSGDETTKDQPAGTVFAGASVVNLGSVNSEWDDFAPVLNATETELLFTSNRPHEGHNTFIDDESKYGEAIFSSVGGGTVWQAPMLNATFSSPRFNSGTLSLTADNRTVFLGASYHEKGAGGNDICITRWNGNAWEPPAPVRGINSPWWDSHPAVSPDGSMLVFASDRLPQPPNTELTGRRQVDLWMTMLDANGNWSPPVPLPSSVNSEASEISPQFGPDGYLYFATDRRENRGFDIARTRHISDTTWTPLEYLPAPVNSAYNDCFPFLTSDRGRILFASDRPGGNGGFDLYAADFPYRIRLAGTVRLTSETGASVPAAGIPITVRDVETGDRQFAVTNEEGRYEIELKANRRYAVLPKAEDCYQSTRTDSVFTSVPFSLDTTLVRDFDLKRVVFAKFELGRKNVPFFVTGYWYPNTKKNLDRLRRRISLGEIDLTPGGKTPYIDPDDEDYWAYAEEVEKIFRELYDTIETRILPHFNKCAGKHDILNIEVRGFVDPRGLAYGIYIDPTVKTETAVIKTGDVMSGQEGNIKLSHLRAYYAARMIEEDLSRRSAMFRRLDSEGRVHWIIRGEGVDPTGNVSRLADAAKRRIDVKLWIE